MYYVTLYFIIGIIYALTDFFGRKKENNDNINNMVPQIAKNMSAKDQEDVKKASKILLIPMDIAVWPLWFVCDICDVINKRRTK